MNNEIKAEYYRYLKSDYSVIPLIGKKPITSDWSKYCLEQSDVEWVESCTGFGICTGPASGIVAVDIDTDNPTVLEKVPDSPVVRRGKKGEVRFFKYANGIESRRYDKIKIEILSIGRQAVLPPSIHPETNLPYQWTKGNLLIEHLELPELDLKFLEQFNLSEAVNYTNGRNNKLVSIASAMFFQGYSPVEVANKLYEYDRINHINRLFLDQNEQFKAKNEDEALQAALKMSANVFKSMASNKKISNDILFINDSKPLDLEGAEIFKPMDWPEPYGILKDIRDYIFSISHFKRPGLALGGTLSIASTIIANYYKCGQTWPNLYCMNIAPSGFGKESANKAAENLLEMFNLIGASGYKSGPAMHIDLDTQRSRLDLIDESASFLKRMVSGASHQDDIIRNLVKLYDNSNGIYRAEKTKAGKIAKEDFVFKNPCISVLFSIQNALFTSSASKVLIDQGLLPRTLLFQDFNNKEPRNFPVENIQLKEKLIAYFTSIRPGGEIFDEIVNKNEQFKQSIAGPAFFANPINIEIDHDAQDLLNQYIKDIDQKMFTENLSDAENSFLARHIQNVYKISLISGAINKQRISLLDAKFAIDLIKSSEHNSKAMVSEINAENKLEQQTNRILNIIKKFGVLSASDLCRKTTFVDRIGRENILINLINSDLVKMYKDSTEKSKKAVCYYKAVKN